jgi:hypothetical protein
MHLYICIVLSLSISIGRLSGGVLFYFHYKVIQIRKLSLLLFHKTKMQNIMFVARITRRLPLVEQ